MTSPSEYTLVEKPILDTLAGQHGYRYIHPDGSWEPQGEGVYDACIAGWVGGESGSVGVYGRLQVALLAHRVARLKCAIASPGCSRAAVS